MQRERGKVSTNTNKEMVGSGKPSKLAEIRKQLEERRKQGKPVWDCREKPVVGKEVAREIIKAKQIEHDKDGRNR